MLLLFAVRSIDAVVAEQSSAARREDLVLRRRSEPSNCSERTAIAECMSGGEDPNVLRQADDSRHAIWVGLILGFGGLRETACQNASSSGGSRKPTLIVLVLERIPCRRE